MNKTPRLGGHTVKENAMKRTRDLKGMPILTLQEGLELGKVREIVVEPSTARIVALLLDKRTPSGEAQVVATANIRNIGPAVVTVEDRSSMVPISRIPRFQELVRAKTPVLGKPVITESGTRLGRVGELLVDPESFRIAAVELKKTFGKGQSIPAEQIRIIGPDAVVIQEKPPLPMPARPAPRPAPSPPAPMVEEAAESMVPPSPEDFPPVMGREDFEQAEPAVPPISTLDIPPAPPPLEEPLPEEEAEELPFEAEEIEAVVPEESETAVLPPDEGVAAEAEQFAVPEGEPEASERAPAELDSATAWQRWVRRLRRREEEEESGNS